MRTYIWHIILISALSTKAYAGWSEWGVWGGCSASCDGGVMVRSRTCDSGPCDGDEVDYTPCNFNDCPMDGVWNEWGAWGGCSRSCDGGTQMRTRSCDGPYQGGAPCEGEDEQSQSCNSFNCPINGGWTLWTSFPECSQTCGGGVQERTRSCTDPAPQYGGWGCPGNDNDFRTCNTEPCPGEDIIDGNWGPWSLVGECSSTCGPGTKTRERSCTNPAPDNGGADCEGPSSQEFDCSDEHPFCPVDGVWGWWTDWASCSKECDFDGEGPGFQIRHRYCDDPAPAYGGANCTDEHEPGAQWQEQDCGGDPCPVTDGVWGSWTDVGSCSRTCGGGQRVRLRHCDSPAPAFGGRDCPDGDPDSSETQTVIVGCNFGPCPIHGGWSLWAEYTECSVTCGTGSQTRTRECTNPLPDHGGQYCGGVGLDTIPCELDVCNIDGLWGLWAAFTECSVSCGGGERVRERWCDSPATSGNGTECEGIASETGVCNTEDCPPLDGAWSRWQTWGPCSKSCGGGLRTRIRSCDSPAPEHGGATCPGLFTQAESCAADTCPPESLLVDGRWTLWTPWSQCTRTCGGGQRRRVRTCTDPEPFGGGRACDNLLQQISRETEIIFCNDNECPIDGGWSPWTAWSVCSASCAGGSQTKSRECDSPAMQFGGTNCIGANSYSNTEVLTQPCNLIDCSALPAPTGPQPTGATAAPTQAPRPVNGSTTTPTPACPEEAAWDDRRWPKTDVGAVASMPCPSPASGLAERACVSGSSWSTVDTSECRTPQFDQLQNEAKKAALNSTAREILMSTFRDTCSPSVVLLAGDLLSCKNVFEHMVNMDIPGDPRIDHWEKADFIASVVSGVSSVIDTGNSDQWYIVVKEEEEDDVSILFEFTEGMETLGKQVAGHLEREHRSSLCRSADNIALCVQKLTCQTTGYRYPLPYPDPTPPPKHVRGGWTPPPNPKLSYVSFPDELTHQYTCDQDEPNIEPRYAVTVSYETIHEFLPDENRKVIPRKDVTATTMASTVDFEYIRKPLAKVVSTTIVSDSLNTSTLQTPIDLVFEHTQVGRDWQCVYLHLKDKVIYNTDGCWLKSVTENTTTCSCSHMTTFLLLGKSGKVEEFEPTGLDTFTLIAGIFMILTSLFLIVAYFFLRLHRKDRYFMLLNILFALLIGHLVHIAGASATADFHGCRFVIFAVHVCFLAVAIWLLFLSGFLFKQLRDHRVLGTKRRIVYVVLGWGIPTLIAAITLGLGYDIYYHDQNVCWLGWHGHVDLSFLLPLVLVTIVSLVILSVGYCQSNKMTEENGKESPIPGQIDYESLLGFIKRVIGLVVLVFITWIMFWVYDFLILFLVLDLALCLYLLLAFLFFDTSVKRAFTRRKGEIKAAKDAKRERPPTPEEPEWVTKMKFNREMEKAAEEQKLKELMFEPAPEVESVQPRAKFAYVPK